MTPLELSAVLHSEEISKLDTVNIAGDSLPMATHPLICTAGDLFTLAIPRRKKSAQKRKSIDTPQTLVPNKKGKPVIFEPTHDVIVIDSDSDDTRSHRSEIVDDDVMVLNTPIEEIVVSDTDSDEPIEIPKSVKNVIQPDGGENAPSNIVININQTVSVDKIVNSALQSIANTSNDCPVLSEKCGISSQNKELSKLTRAIGYPKSWTKDMIKFYTEPCEKYRNFNYVEILKNFKTKPSDWWINRADMMGPSRSRRSHTQCHKCYKYGHIERECTKNFVCYTCGDFSHMFPNCPNTLCLTCGRPAAKNLRNCDRCRKVLTEKKPCSLCGQVYHEEMMCPSKWRKHLKLNSPSQPIRLNPRKYCYNCAEAGHFGFECPFTPDSEYPQENPLKTSFFEDHVRESEALQNDDAVIFLSKETADLLSSEQGNQFLKRISEGTNARIEFFCGAHYYIKIVGQEAEVDDFKTKLELLKLDTLRTKK